jgi:hypothetical protein
LVNVQVTVSFGLTLMFETGLPSSQVALVRTQLAGTVSATLYPEPAKTSGYVNEPPFFRLKLSGSARRRPCS